MGEKSESTDALFYQLVLSLHASGMQQLGKVMSPLTGKVERDLDGARQSIDLLDMLKRKTAGNLAEAESKLVDHALYELRLNYVDEMKKGDQPDEGAEETSSEAASSPDEKAAPEQNERREENSGESGPKQES